MEDQYQPPASDSLIVSEQNLKNIRLSDDFAALHEGRAESKSKRALSNNPGKFISEEYKLNYYLKQYITGGVILIGCTIFIYLYLRKYTNFKFKDLKIRLEEKINEIEMYVQTVERLNKQSANLNILLTTQKQSHYLYLDFLVENWQRIQTLLREVQTNEELVLNNSETANIKLLIKQNLNILMNLEENIIACLDVTEVNIGNVIRNLIKIFHYEILEKEIAFFPETNKDFYVETDQLLLSLILFNIIESCVNRLSNNKFLTMHILKRKGCINFLIIDEGYGVIPLYREKRKLFFLEEEAIQKLAQKLGLTIITCQKKGTNSTSIKIPNAMAKNAIKSDMARFNKSNVIQLADYKK